MKIFITQQLAALFEVMHIETMNLRTDQYTHVPLDCPLSTDVHPADDVVEIVLGEHRFGYDTLRLVVDHPDTCLRLTAALDDARDKLARHLHAKAYPDPAMSQLNR